MAKKTVAKAPALSRKQEFIKRLAEYLAKDQAKWSIKLEMGDENAKTWAALRSWTPLMGYPTIEEAEKLLTEFLG